MFLSRSDTSFLLTCLLLLSWPTIATSAEDRGQAFDPGKAPFTVRVNNTRLHYRIAMRALLSGEALILEWPQITGFQLQQGTTAIATSANKFSWVSPEKAGHYPFTITRLEDGAQVQLQVFVMQPASRVRDRHLNGYRIGNYPTPKYGLASYQPPAGFIEVTQALQSQPVSPHFRLGQFLCKQAGGSPKYLVLRPKLLNKLELLLADINKRGINTDSFVIMSGYRTPFYNRAIGNVRNSRHLYGDAADIFVDVEPLDTVMDDLDGDGKSDVGDAAWLYRLADRVALRNERPDLIGGLGKYNGNAAHGPFVHVDVRGSRARWGF